LLRLGIASVAVEYKPAPGAKYPSHLDESFTGFKYLTDKLGYKPSDIILSGESAGGLLIAALTLRLKRLGLGTPNACFFSSPMTDCTLSLPSHKLNIGKDRTFPNGVSQAFIEGYVDPKLVKEPEVSPWFGDLSGFPPSYFVVDDTEVLASDTLEFAAKLYSLSVKVQVHVFHGLWHVFCTDIENLPESKEVFNDVAKFLGVA
jgi:acetyl esterase/lipase